MTAMRSLPPATVLGVALSFFTPVLAGVPTVPSSPSAPTGIVLAQLNTDAQIYLLRGLANVFSLGMDELAGKLEKQGFSPHVINWKFWPSAAGTIANNYRTGQTAPIIIIGHSLGADAVFPLAENLREKNIPVDYMVTFDVTKPHVLPQNVRSFVNYYQRNGFGRPVSAPPGYHGELSNIDLTGVPGLTHGNIEEFNRLHEDVIRKIIQITGR